MKSSVVYAAILLSDIVWCYQELTDMPDDFGDDFMEVLSRGTGSHNKA